ncbi:MAG: (E)-4-hydroxy-3-methylbut-2-enyl-diphosphate synthase [Methylacidiphilales bacterium]|nr:(E)-4-hydroxy-3-methylbut-2-enyl-diphosphate synthase [Candidatus Methylacidiphilales bacterium]MDW8349234.1 (E)-4-hydroxy-3-methylbut-2-enyl-diphosphate synthase [Verrucomicrobiae bacterium]
MDEKLVYLREPYVYKRRVTRAVRVGKVQIGGGAPIVVQSMLTCDTMDTAKCVEQTLELVKVGCEVVRIAAPTVKDAANLRNIKEALLARGCDVPIVADIHFKPEAAMEAAQWADGVRINPGNFADKKKFQVREYTREQYEEELQRIEECFAPLVKLCLERGIAMRIGTNHGSLSDRIMNYYGDTPLGMVESALEYARVARKYGYHNFVFSMKSSNPKVMIQAYRLLVAKLDAEGPDWNYPLHLGVTEAGDGEDGRIKSAIGIGSLLMDGIGDTIRVSLTEESVYEIPVGRALVAWVEKLQASCEGAKISPPLGFDPFSFERRAVPVFEFNGVRLGKGEPARVVVTREQKSILENQGKGFGETPPELVFEELRLIEVDPENREEIEKVNALAETHLITVPDGCRLNPITAYRLLDAQLDKRHALLIKDTFRPPQPGVAEGLDPLESLIAASVVIGSLVCDGIGDAIWVRSEPGAGAALRLSYNILQAAGNRTFKTDYVACPSCGRTLFNLQATTARIKAATSHLKGVKIAIMGCIVNGPGEMADADFGYVGGAPGKINLYVGKNPVKFNIPEEEAVDRLKDLIREHGKWTDP